MLKRYQVGAFVLQYEEGHQPAGAVEVGAAKPQAPAKPRAQAAAKARKPANKARAAANK